MLLKLQSKIDDGIPAMHFLYERVLKMLPKIEREFLKCYPYADYYVMQ